MMEKSDRKVGKLFLVFVGICVAALPMIVYSAISGTPEEIDAAVIETRSRGFDLNSGDLFESHNRLARAYMEGASPGRTLDEYYSLRQYPGSPPYIPHMVANDKGEKLTCLSCHGKGGWTEELKRHTPVTPHPENIYCGQCHVKMTTENLFVAIDWMSVAPPRLGRSHLPGSPPPIPHDLQMRGNCVACHVGPGAVATIRVEHPSRGSCRQCHVPDSFAGLFQR